MRQLIVTFLFFAGFGISAFAQDIDYSKLIQYKPQATPYYQKPGSMQVQLSNHMFKNTYAITPPVNLQYQVATIKNLMIGPSFTYFRFKYKAAESQSRTVWKDGNVKYDQYTLALRGEYHLSPTIENILNKRVPYEAFDIYLAGWGGYVMAGSTSSGADKAFMESVEEPVGGVSLGLRSFVLPKLAFSVEAGYGSYGYGSFGIVYHIR